MIRVVELAGFSVDRKALPLTESPCRSPVLDVDVDDVDMGDRIFMKSIYLRSCLGAGMSCMSWGRGRMITDSENKTLDGPWMGQPRSSLS